MSEVMTEAGRAHLDEWWPNIMTDDEPDDYENIDRQDARKAIRAIEDEAARKERERITNLPRWTKGMEAVGGEWIRVAAITDTGEEAAP